MNDFSILDSLFGRNIGFLFVSAMRAWSSDRERQLRNPCRSLRQFYLRASAMAESILADLEAFLKIQGDFLRTIYIEPRTCRHPNIQPPRPRCHVLPSALSSSPCHRVLPGPILLADVSTFCHTLGNIYVEYNSSHCHLIYALKKTPRLEVVCLLKPQPVPMLDQYGATQ